MPRPLVFLILALPLVGAYAMYATGIVVIHRASRVINLAHGAMATIPAYLVYTMVGAWGIPTVAAVPLGVASGAGMGLMIERVFVRRLRDAGATAQTVGTVAAFGLSIALAAKVWGTGGVTAPAVFPEAEIGVGNSILQAGHLGMLGVAILLTVVLSVLQRRTWLGLALRAAASNRRAAALMGADPDQLSAVAWALGGALAATAGILLAALTVLHPVSLSASVLPAFVAALIGGLESLGGALLGSVLVGVVLGMVPLLSDVPGLSGIFGQVGGPELALAIIAMVVMARRGTRSIAEQRAVTPTPRAPATAWLPRLPPRALLALAIGWVWIPGVPFTILGDANQALLSTIVAASMVLLTGWLGQISLAHAAFVGVGAFGSVQIAERLGLPFPFTIPAAGLLAAAVAVTLGLVAVRVRGLYLAVATLIFAWMADQYLFSASWLVGAGGSATARVDPIGVEGGFPSFDLADRRVFYLVALAGATLVLVALSNLRRSKTGRALFAIRGSEEAAAAMGVDVTRTKLLVFGLSGAIAGMAGSLLVVGQGTIVPAQFASTASLLLLSIAVVGGLRSLGGAVAASVLFAALNEVFFRVEALRGWLDVVAAGLLVAVLLFFPGGLARAPELLAPVRRWMRARSAGIGSAPARAPSPSARRVSRTAVLLARQAGREVLLAGREIGRAADAMLASAGARAPAPWRARIDRLRAQMRGVRGEAVAVVDAARGVRARLATIASEVDVPSPSSTPDALARETPVGAAPRAGRRGAGALLEASDVSVTFGGITALSGATIAVHQGEIVGLIGPNGAGKTTLVEAIAGSVTPDAGRVALLGDDMRGLAVHQRAARGLARTFQLVRVIPDLSVRDNLLVATHVRNPATFAGDLVLTNRSLIGEQAALARVLRAAELTELIDVLDDTAGALPFATLRRVEVARALVTGAPVVMLDEPAAGLDEAGSRRFGALLEHLRATLGIGILLIEHDMRLVMSVCDYVYVLDRGTPIAEGTPAALQGDRRVIDAYLGRAGSRTPVTV